MFGLGKGRTRFGKFIDKHMGYGGQERLAEVSKVSRDTIRKACNDEAYRPSRSIRQTLIFALEKITGKSVKQDDFWM